MAYVYANARLLDGQPKLEDEECVALIRRYTSAPHTSAWKQGIPVMGNKNILPGTAIATFEKAATPHGQITSTPGFTWDRSAPAYG